MMWKAEIRRQISRLALISSRADLIVEEVRKEMVYEIRLGIIEYLPNLDGEEDTLP